MVSISWPSAVPALFSTHCSPILAILPNSRTLDGYPLCQNWSATLYIPVLYFYTAHSTLQQGYSLKEVFGAATAPPQYATNAVGNGSAGPIGSHAAATRRQSNCAQNAARPGEGPVCSACAAAAAVLCGAPPHPAEDPVFRAHSVRQEHLSASGSHSCGGHHHRCSA